MRAHGSWFLLLLAVLLLLSAPRAVVAGTIVFDTFESYPLGSSMNPPPTGTYAANWDSDVAFSTANAAWGVGIDSTYAGDAGQFILMYGLRGSTPNVHWVAFTINESAPILEATLSFDYLVETYTSLTIHISETGATTDLVAVPFTFTKRYNQGQIVDNTGAIDLTSYLTGTSDKLVVILTGRRLDPQRRTSALTTSPW